MLPAILSQQGYFIRFTLVVGFMSNAALVMLDRNRWIEEGVIYMALTASCL